MVYDTWLPKASLTIIQQFEGISILPVDCEVFLAESYLIKRHLILSSRSKRIKYDVY
jgi:hypothetical protein